MDCTQNSPQDRPQRLRLLRLHHEDRLLPLLLQLHRQRHDPPHLDLQRYQQTQFGADGMERLKALRLGQLQSCPCERSVRLQTERNSLQRPSLLPLDPQIPFLLWRTDRPLHLRFPELLRPAPLMLHNDSQRTRRNSVDDAHHHALRLQSQGQRHQFHQKSIQIVLESFRQKQHHFQ